MYHRHPHTGVEEEDVAALSVVREAWKQSGSQSLGEGLSEMHGFTMWSTEGVKKQ